MYSNVHKYTNVKTRGLQLPAELNSLPEDVKIELERRLSISYFAQLHAVRLQRMNPADIQTKIVRVPDVQLAYRALEDSKLFGLCVLLDKSCRSCDIRHSLVLCVSLSRTAGDKLFYVLCYES